MQSTTKCECGHGLSRHDTEDGPCSKCECVEFQASAVCTNCGNAHDPDVSADIAEEATW